MKNEIEKFDNYLKKLSKKKLHALGEVSFMLLDFIKIKPNTDMQPLINRVSTTHTFNSVDEVNLFLKTYFDFHNKFINYTSTIFMIIDEQKFHARVEDLVTNLLNTLSLKEQKEFMIDFIDRVYDAVFEEFALEINEKSDPRVSIKKATKSFKSEELALLFFSLIGITHELEADKNITTQKELTQLSSSVFVFLLALNEQRKNQFVVQTQTEESPSSNNTFYNVGRNDPCPCGSGRKYKKCCLHKNEPKSDTLFTTKKPSNAPKPLSEKEIDEFYSTWTKFFEFASKIYCEMYHLQYQKSYIKDEFGKFTLDVRVIDSNLANDVRRFITINFNRLSGDFQNKKVTKKDKDLISNMSFSYKFAKFYAMEFFEDGGAIFFDSESEISYFVHSLYDPIGIMVETYQVFETMLLSYKGRIITDGMFAMYNIQVGDNMKQMLQNSFKTSSKDIRLSLEENEIEHKIYQLKINIKGSKPNIWRKIEVPSTISFYELHTVIQAIFNWHDSHLWEFITSHGNYGDKDELSQGMFGESNELPAQNFSIDHVLKNEKDKMIYVYDFGDDWVHNIILEKVIKSDKELKRPRFISGRRATPFEDCGGIYVYNEIVQAIENGVDEEGEIFDEYGTEPFDPASFDSQLLKKIFN